MAMAATLTRCVRVLAANNLKNLAFQSRLIPRIVSSTRHFCRSAVIFADRKYSEKHEWVTVEGSVGTIGISNYAQEALGDIVYAQLPDVGAEFDRDDECGALESVKAASEIYTPLSGTVTEKNEAVEEKPALINEAPYGEGWLFKMEMKEQGELDDLMDEAGYAAFLKAQED